MRYDGERRALDFTYEKELHSYLMEVYVVDCHDRVIT